ncbi:MAG: PilZ domain-containing protein [Planctomycetota bacterium]
MSHDTETDRRRHRRTQVDRPGKAFLRHALRYLPVRALDVSVGGMLLEIRSERTLSPGERLDVVVSDGHAGLVESSEVVPATIAHVRRTAGGTQHVGLEFLVGEPADAATTAAAA